jgi:hypothetical protein
MIETQNRLREKVLAMLDRAIFTPYPGFREINRGFLKVLYLGHLFVKTRRVTEYEDAMMEGLTPALDMENRMARMLRLDPGEMINPFCLVSFGRRMMVGLLTRTAQAPRGDVSPRGFLFFDFFREIFHTEVETLSRPLRGGKEGPACRVM